MVDDAIVVVEGVQHHIEEGLSPKDAAIKAMPELSGPVVGIALVLTSVFATPIGLHLISSDTTRKSDVRNSKSK